MNSDNILSEEQNRQIYLGRIIAAILSTIGICVIFITYIMLIIKKANANKGHYNWMKLGFGHNMILLISISDLICCIATFIDLEPYKQYDNHTTTSCIIQAFLFNFSEISTICLTTILSFSIYYVTLKKKSFDNLWIFLLLLYGICPALILSIIPLPYFMNVYGVSGAWCWIQTHESQDSTVIFKNAEVISILIFVFNWLNMLFNIYVVLMTLLYFKDLAYLVSEKNEKQAYSLKKFCLFLTTFPFILIICWYFPTLNRLSDFITEKENYLYFMGTGIAMSSMGLLNSIVYFITYFKDNFACCSGNNQIYVDNEPFNLCCDEKNQGNNLPFNSNQNGDEESYDESN